jgi:hypothetical protein
VLGDDKLLWTSKLIQKKGDAQPCRVEVTKVDVLELRVKTPGVEWGSNAVWVDPAVLRSASEAPAPKPWLVGPELKLGDLTARELGDGANQVLPTLAWSADAKAFFVLEAGGVVRRIGWPGLQEEKRVELGLPARSLAVCKLGLLVLVETPQTELWLLDPADLDTQRKGPLPDVARLTSGPGLSVAVAEGQPGDEKAPRVKVLDIARFILAAAYTEKDLLVTTSHLIDSSCYQMTPDGRYLLGCTNLGQLVRWRINGARLTLEEIGPSVGPDHGQVVVSADGKHVCLLHPGGNDTTAEGHPALDEPGTYVYEVRNLRKPAFSLTQGKGLSALAFDVKAGLVYTNNGSSTLLRYGMTGTREKDYTLQGGATRQVLPHPDGRKLLLLTESRLFAVEFAPE